MGLLDTATRPLRTATRIGGRVADQGVQQLRRLTGQEHQSESPPKEFDDVTIARKVETVIFRSSAVDKGKIDVNVVDGIVWLRGVAKNPAQVESLEAKAMAIPEVVDVQNLLHLPKTAAPSRTDTPSPARATRRKRTAPAQPRTEPRRLNADKTVEQNEDLPETLARTRKGRQPAKLGASETAAPGGTTAPTPAERSRVEPAETSGPPKPATTDVGTERGPGGGGGEVVQ